MITIDIYDTWKQLLAIVNISKDGFAQNEALAKWRNDNNRSENDERSVATGASSE